MRIFKRLLIVFAVLVLIAFVGVKVYTRITSDTTPPVIAFDSDTITVSVRDGRSALLAGVTATDNKDGDISRCVLIHSISQFTSARTAQVSYIVFDDADNFSTASRSLVYSDYTPPRFDLTHPLVYTPGTSIVLNDVVTAEDVLDGDLSDSIQLLASGVTANYEGLYFIELQVANSMGDISRAEIPVLIRSTSKQCPVITLKTPIVYLKQGDSFNARDYLESVLSADASIGGSTPVSIAMVQTESNVDTAAAGSYYVVYRYANAGGYEASTCLAVIVEG